MPTKTFLNLAAEKRERIVQAAMEEFAANPFERASLTSIVSKLGIAKGSMYQYFKNKQDLYFYIIHLAYDTKRDYLKDVFVENQDFFVTVSRYYQQSYLFAQEYPLYHQVITNFWESKDEQLRDQILANKELRASDFTALLKEAISKGLVRESVSERAAFFVYHSVGKELIDNFPKVEPGKVEEHLQFIKQVLSVLRYGLETR